MNHYQEYIKEIEERKAQGLHPKPIDSAELVHDLIAQIKDTSNAYRADSLQFFIYNTLPGTTPAAGAKAHFLKQIILGEEILFVFKLKESFDYLNVPFYILLGAIAGLTSLYYARITNDVEAFFDRFKDRKYLRAIVGGLLLSGLYTLNCNAFISIALLDS
jgi:hypothetical protein